MKKFTFILTSMLFLLVWGGVKVCAQADNLSLTPLYEAEVNDGVVQFKNTNLSYSCLGGASWAKTFNTGEIHIFTVTIAESSSINTTTTLCLTASTTEVSKFGSPIIVGETSTSVSPTEDGTKQLVLRVESNYGAVYLWQSAGERNGWGKVKIASITREVVTASSVGKPTIAAPATYDDEPTAVTITPGANNHHVKYSVFGSSSDVLNVQITSETTIYITGSNYNDVTITAVGYNQDESESNTNTKTITYSNDIQDGKTNIANNISKAFSSWDDNLQYNNEFQNKVGLYDYVVLSVSNMTQDHALLGFRDGGNGWNEEPYKSCTTVSRGDGAKGVINNGETQWWLKVSNDDVLSAFSRQVVIQGGLMSDERTPSPITLNSIDVYKSFAISETENNSITKYNNVVVELTRSFVAGTWNTVCLPFALTSAQATQLFGSDYKLAAFTGVSGTTMKFTTIDDIAEFAAGKPYLVMPKEGCATGTTVLFDVNITAKNPTPVTFSNGDDDYTFRGTFTTKTFTSADNMTSRFVATENELMTPEEDTTLKSLRCYFTVSATAPARSLSFDVDEEGGTTSINTVQGSGVMVNGYYNLAGQRVAQPTKGLYIVNGKKVVIK